MMPKSIRRRVDVPKGDPRDPMTEEEIAVKIHRARWRSDRQRSMSTIAEVHHEFGKTLTSLMNFLS